MKNELKKRFTNEYRLPIPIFEDFSWDYYLDLYQRDYQARDKWKRLLKGIEEDYSGNHNEFLTDFYKVREELIVDLKGRSWFNEYKDGDWYKKDEYQIQRNYRKDHIYNNSFVNESYLSVDLKKANFQALSYFSGEWGEEDVDDLYYMWLSKFTTGHYLDSYIKESKYIREVVFGNINPKRQIIIEKMLIGKVLDYILSHYENIGEVVQFGNDEFILKTDRIIDTKKIKEDLWIDVKAELFTLKSYRFNKGNGELTVYRKKPLESDSERGCLNEYKGVPKAYSAQLVEWIYDLDPDKEERDLMFYADGELAKFTNRIKLM